MILLVPAVQADRPHVVGLAEPLRLALGELGATQPPADEEVLSLQCHTALVFREGLSSELLIFHSFSYFFKSFQLVLSVQKCKEIFIEGAGVQCQ